MQTVPPSQAVAVSSFVLNLTTIFPTFAKLVAKQPVGSSDRSTSVTIVLVFMSDPDIAWFCDLGCPFHSVVAVLHSAAVAMGVAQVPLVCLYLVSKQEKEKRREEDRRRKRDEERTEKNIINVSEFQRAHRARNKRTTVQ